MAPFFGENIYLIVEENALPAAEKKENENTYTHTRESCHGGANSKKKMAGGVFLGQVP